MPESATADYITKTEAARIYRRSERSISRDITNAVKHGDQRVLQHVELRLEDGTRRPGTELTIDEIVDLRDRGFNPTWLLQTAWLTEAYGRRDEPLPTTSVFPEAVERVTQDPQYLPDDLEQRVAVLEAQNSALRQSNIDLRSQAERLEKELDRRAEERREENELQKQSNVLMQQVYGLLSKMQETTGTLSLPPPRSIRHQPETVSTVDTKPADLGKGTTQHPTKVATKNKSNPNRHSPGKPGTHSKQKPVAAASPKRTRNPEPAKTTRLQRWFPTLLGSNRKRKK